MTIIDKDLLNIVSVLAKESSRLRMNRRQVEKNGGTGTCFTNNRS